MRKSNLSLLLILILFVVSPLRMLSQPDQSDIELLKSSVKDTLVGWKWNGMTALNFNNTYLSNWAAGGEGSVALNGFFNFSTLYKTEKTSWTNTLDLGYGVLRKGTQSKFIKSDDKIDLLTKFGRQVHQHFYYSAAINIKTQFSPGYKNPDDSLSISDFLAPAFLIAAVGMDFKPKDVSILVAPLTSKFTIVNNRRLADAGAFGVKPATYDSVNGRWVKAQSGEMFKQEFGGYVRLIFSKSKFENEWLKNIAISAKLDLFSNYLHNPQNIDLNGETQILFKVNKLFSVSIVMQFIYDDDITFKDADGKTIGPKFQFKNINGIGLTHKF